MRSLLDGKFSNFIKSQQAFKLDKNALVKLEISIDAAANTIINVEELKQRLHQIKGFKFTKEEIEWLNSTEIFDESYLEWLSVFKVPKMQLTSKDSTCTISLQDDYSKLILLEVGLQALLCEARFGALQAASGQEDGYFFAFATDRFNIKASTFFNSKTNSLVEDSSAFRPDSDFYSLQTILMAVNNFNYVGTTNPIIAFNFGQPVVAFCDEERWFEGWPDLNFAPSETLYNKAKHKGFFVAEPTFVLLNEMRSKHPEAIIIANELPPFEMAHATGHFGNIVWLWSQDLIQDMNIEKYSARVSWTK